MFKYPKTKYRPLLPIPMKLPTDAKEMPQVEVFGMAVDLPAKLKGMRQAYVTVLEKSFIIEIGGSRNIAFKTFDLKSELAELPSVSRMLARENK